MNRNIEIKAQARDFTALKRRAEELTDTPPEIIVQEDVFFHTPKGRLKLRIFSPTRAQLIYYERDDHSGPKQSNYILSETPNPDTLKATLTAALGIRGVIRKRRTLYRIAQTRIHLDEVQDLGNFIELEVVLSPAQPPAEGHQIARDLMKTLAIPPEDLIPQAYIDLLPI